MKPTQQEPHRNTDLPATGLSPEMRKRLAIAGGLVAVALAAIPLLESFSGSDKPASSSVGSSGRIVSKEEPLAASAPTLVIAQLPDSSAAASSAPAASPATDSRPAAPTPGSPLPATPAPGTVTAPAGTTSPTAAKPAVAANSRPLVTNTATTPASTNPAPKPAPAPLAMRKAVPATTEEVAVPATPSTPQLAPRVMPTLPGSKNSSPSLGYQVQLGLFSSSMNAEKLVADLKKQGLAARTETRVQLGPFRTRAEAEEAMQRLRELGYQPMLIPIGTH